MPSADPDDRLLDALRGAAEGSGGSRPEAHEPEEIDADLDVLGRLGRAARALSADDLVLDEPPPAVWAGIAAAVEADAAGATGPAGSAAPAAPAAHRDPVGPAEPAGPSTPGPVPLAPEPPAPGAGAGPTVSTATGDVTPPGPAGWIVHEGGATPDAAPPSSATRPAAATPAPGEAGPRHARPARAHTRPRPAGWLLAAVAAVTLLVVAVAAALITGGDGGDVVASARLQPLQQVSAVTAEVVDGGDGAQLVVPLDDADLPPESAAFYEVWLIDSNIEGMVSLGPMRADGTYDIPTGVDFRRYPVVDVSIEPTDGNPTHSSNSVLRGTLS